MSQAKREWYQRNKELVKERSRVQRRRNYEWLCEQKRKPCVDCGRDWPPYVMQFHHKPGTVKVANVSNLIQRAGRKRIEAEIAKCELLCGNCHAIRTHQHYYDAGATLKVGFRVEAKPT